MPNDSVPRLAVLRQLHNAESWHSLRDQRSLRVSNPRLYKLAQFFGNPDPMKLLKVEARADRAQLFHRPPAGTRGAYSYVLCWEGRYIRVAPVGDCAQLRSCGKLEHPCTAARVTLDSVPIAVRHVMAGWIRMIYDELHYEWVSAGPSKVAAPNDVVQTMLDNIEAAVKGNVTRC